MKIYPEKAGPDLFRSGRSTADQPAATRLHSIARRPRSKSVNASIGYTPQATTQLRLSTRNLSDIRGVVVFGVVQALPG
jgi:hypothetical protein